MEVVDDFNAASEGFLSWFKQVPGARFHEALRIEDLRSRKAGRGIIATHDITAETELFSIPRNAIITVENSSLIRDYPKFFEDLNSSTLHGDVDQPEDEDLGLDPWLRLIVTMMYEHMKGGNSPWRPYLTVLPTEFDTLMFWSDEELQELQASGVRNKVGKASANELFQGKVLPLIQASPLIFQTSLNDDQLMELAHRMGSIIMAYAFDLEKDEDETRPEEAEDGWIEDREGQSLGMVPMADTLNADAEFNCHLNHGVEMLTMTTIREIKAGEEVLNYYGPLPTSDLLRRYGYTSSKHHVHDVVEIEWAAVVDTIKAFSGLSDADLEKPLEKLEDHEDFEDSFVLEYQDASPDDTGVLPGSTPEFTELPESMTAQIKRLFKYLKKTKPDFDLDDASFWEIIKRILEQRVQEYGTSLEEDHRILRNLESHGLVDRKSRRQYMAVTVRAGEKELLSRATTFAAGKASAMGNVNGAPQPKRRRL